MSELLTTEQAQTRCKNCDDAISIKGFVVGCKPFSNMQGEWQACKPITEIKCPKGKGVPLEVE